MDTAAILPVKRFARAKQRLSRSVGEQLRHELAGAMVGDVLEALAQTPAIALTIVVTAQPELVPPGAARTLIVDDGPQAGQSAAASLGIARALADSFERVLCVPGDCPALDPAELQQLLGPSAQAQLTGAEGQAARGGARAAGAGARVVGIPDRHGTGTNGLLLSPPDAIAPSFGPGSFARHRELALAAGAGWSVERPPSLLLDIDTGEDLQVLRERLASSDARAPRTRAALARAGGPEGSGRADPDRVSS